MFTSFRRAAIVIVVATTIMSCGVVSAQVVSGSQITFTTVNNTNGQYRAAVSKGPIGDDDTVIFFDSSDKTIVATNSSLDEESDWYLVNPGDTFSLATIAMNPFPIIFTTDDPRPPVSIPLGDFYLGAATTSGFVPNRNVFGWLELDNTGTTLIPLDNAVAYGDQGIIIGTTTAIAPEPASLSLLLLAALPLLTRRSRRH